MSRTSSDSDNEVGDPPCNRPAHPGLRIVIVDDAADNADIFAELLTSYGHSVRVAYQGSATLALLAHELPDVVFLDVNLPDIDGYEVASTIRTRFGATILLVALTGYSGTRERDAAHHAGCDRFVVKPFRFADIQTLLAGVMEARST